MFIEFKRAHDIKYNTVVLKKLISIISCWLLYFAWNVQGWKWNDE